MSALNVSSAFSWNPALRLPEAGALALAFVGLAVWLAWRGSATGSRLTRVTLVTLRALAVGLVAILWLNPGQWNQRAHEAGREWLVLLDRSASMAAEHDERQSRWDAGRPVARELQDASDGRSDVHVRTFAAQLDQELGDLDGAGPDGDATNLQRSISAALDQRATSLAGIVVISDGRETDPGDLDRVALRARGLGIPIHAVPVGAGWGSRDLSVSAAPRQVLAFKDQPARISARVENRGLGNIRPDVMLIAPDGSVAGRTPVELKDGDRKTLAFEVASVPSSGGNYSVRCDPWPGEQLPANNADTVRVNLLDARIRVLLLEGAPYWDSKFLAQLLRRQAAVQIETIHCLSEDRFFRVGAEGVEPLSSADEVFPPSPEALARYDLIVFGKGAEFFLGAGRVAALAGFVRDQGGAVLFARGKPYGSRFPALESLEPVEWDAPDSGKFRFIPTGDETNGLFGAVLPAVDDSVWQSLASLEDVHGILRLKPFARVVAEGAPEGRQTRVPLLVARRYGRGMVATVNADGLWRWEFHSEAPDDGRVYQQFWVQLMQWCATYSEFRPGEDYAVRLREASARPGHAVRAMASWRGPASANPQPELRIYKDGNLAGTAATTALPDAEEGREWVGILTLNEPGSYSIRVADPSRPDREEGEAVLRIQAPAGEKDDLRPDPAALASLARGSGGSVIEPPNAGRLAAMIRGEDISVALQGKAEWKPLWPQWWVALAVCVVFGGEWWLRRREGLL